MVSNSILPLDNKQLSAISRLFSARVIQEMSRKGRSPLFARLVHELYESIEVDLATSVRDFFDAAFTYIKKKDSRNEYVYKTAIAHKILLGTHSLTTASMLSEFRVGTSKADVVILNGTSTVYEIKSERDNLDRLRSQIDDYLKVFARVNVITGENHLDAVIHKIPSDVGVLLLTGRHQISTIREPIEDASKIIPSILFDSLQLKEAKRIFQHLGLEVPTAPNTQMYKIMHEIFAELDPVSAHSAMVHVLKQTRSQRSLLEYYKLLPSSLHAAAFSTSIRKSDYGRLVNAMDTQLDEALSWG